MNLELEVLIGVDDEIAPAMVPTTEQIERWASAVLLSRLDRAVVDLRLIGAEPMRELNATFRHKDYATNVLSFPADLDQSSPVPLLGDIAICPAVVKREADEQGKPYEDHFAHLLVHGLLHLLGYDHTSEAEAEEMEAEEIAILGDLGITDPYSVVAHQGASAAPTA